MAIDIDSKIKEFAREILKKKSFYSQRNKALCEITELSLAIHRHQEATNASQKRVHRSNIHEEIIDVKIMLEQLILMFNKEEYENIAREKLIEVNKKMNLNINLSDLYEI